LTFGKRFHKTPCRGGRTRGRSCNRGQQGKCHTGNTRKAGVESPPRLSHATATAPTGSRPHRSAAQGDAGSRNGWNEACGHSRRGARGRAESRDERQKTHGRSEDVLWALRLTNALQRTRPHLRFWVNLKGLVWGLPLRAGVMRPVRPSAMRIGDQHQNRMVRQGGSKGQRYGSRWKATQKPMASG
jgi:hypothetical protein